MRVLVRTELPDNLPVGLNHLGVRGDVSSRDRCPTRVRPGLPKEDMQSSQQDPDIVEFLERVAGLVSLHIVDGVGPLLDHILVLDLGRHLLLV